MRDRTSRAARRRSNRRSGCRDVGAGTGRGQRRLSIVAPGGEIASGVASSGSPLLSKRIARIRRTTSPSARPLHATTYSEPFHSASISVAADCPAMSSGPMRTRVPSSESCATTTLPSSIHAHSSRPGPGAMAARERSVTRNSRLRIEVAPGSATEKVQLYVKMPGDWATLPASVATPYRSSLPAQNGWNESARAGGVSSVRAPSSVTLIATGPANAGAAMTNAGARKATPGVESPVLTVRSAAIGCGSSTSPDNPRRRANNGDESPTVHAVRNVRSPPAIAGRPAGTAGVSTETVLPSTCDSMRVCVSSSQIAARCSRTRAMRTACWARPE